MGSLDFCPQVCFERVFAGDKYYQVFPFLGCHLRDYFMAYRYVTLESVFFLTA